MKIKAKKSTRSLEGLDPVVAMQVSNADRDWFEHHPDQVLRARRLVPGELPTGNWNYVLVRLIPGIGRRRSGTHVPEELLEPGCVAGRDWTIDFIDGEIVVLFSATGDWPPEEKIRFEE